MMELPSRLFWVCIFIFAAREWSPNYGKSFYKGHLFEIKDT